MRKWIWDLRAHALALQLSSADDLPISSTTRLLAYDDQPLPAIVRHSALHQRNQIAAQPSDIGALVYRPHLLVDDGRRRGDGAHFTMYPTTE